jgi:hypothetical protein
MKPAKILFLFLLYLAGSCTQSFAQHRLIRWAVQKHGTLWVNGSSNVNEFTCSITSISEYDTIIAVYDPLKAVTLRGAIRMNILSFDCQNNMIRKDLRKTLKAEEYPTMTIRFLTLKTMPLLSAKAEQVTGWVEVELAGVRKKFELNYSFRETSLGIMRLNGGRKFHFSDFSLAPPEKFAGLIKIRDEFDVNFMLILKTM